MNCTDFLLTTVVPLFVPSGTAVRSDAVSGEGPNPDKPSYAPRRMENSARLY